MSALIVDHRTAAVEPAVEPAVELPLPIPAQGGRCVRLVALLSSAALVPMIIAHLIGARVVNPLTDPISWYAFVPGGAAMIMAGGSLLALLGALITIRLYRGGLARGPWPAVAMGIFSLALIMVGLCRTGRPDAASTIGAIVHRISAGTAFAVLPLIGLMVSKSITDPRTGLPRRLRQAAYGLAVLVGIFLSVHLPLAFAGSGIAAFGFLERAGFVIMIGYLLLLAAVIDRESIRTTSAGRRSAARDPRGDRTARRPARGPGDTSRSPAPTASR